MNIQPPDFNEPAQKKTIEALIEFIKAEKDPAKINAALLAASDNPPFYPDDAKLTGFLFAASADPAFNQKFLDAGALSAPAREAVLAANRTSNRDGAFTNFIYFDPAMPSASKIFKVMRAPHVGGGIGAWGGLRDDDDVNVFSTVDREVFEEVIDAVKLLIKLHDASGGTENAFDQHLADARAKKEPLSNGVKSFIASLPAEQDTLRDSVMDLAGKAQSLITDLVAAKKHKLFTCRDDAHAIKRGWGFRVDAYAHFSPISKHTAEAFEDIERYVRNLKKIAEAQGIPGVGGEMTGIAIYTLKSSPERVKESHYGHEALAEIIGFASLAMQSPHANPNGIWEDFRKSGAVDVLATKMRLQPEALKDIYDKALASNILREDFITIPDDEYKKAYAAKTAQPLKPSAP